MDRRNSCVVCGGAPQAAGRDSLGYYVCAACGLAWNDAAEPPDLAGDWETDYYGDEAILKLHRARRSAMEAITTRLSALCPERGRLLDVGSGLGFLMESAARSGWTVEGIEASPTAAESARSLTGAPVTVGLMETVTVPAGAFDAVTLLDTLRCAPDPMALLQSTKRALRPGGLLMVREINRAFLRAGAGLVGRRIKARSDGRRKAFEYAQRFSPRSILQALRLAGFSGCWVEPSPMFREKDAGGGSLSPLLKDGLGWACEAVYRVSGKRLVVSPNLLAFGRAASNGSRSAPAGAGG